MNSSDSVLIQIRGLSSNAEDLSHLLRLLRKSEDSLRSFSSRLFTALPSLDPTLYSLGYLFILDAVQLSNISNNQIQQWMSLTISFCVSCSSDQIQLAPDKFTAVCHHLKEYLVGRKEPLRGIHPLKFSVLKLRPTQHHLTPLHADFFQLCILAKCYHAAQLLLEDSIFEVNPKQTSVNVTDFLLYCYYGGLCLIGLKRFDQAMELFHHAIVAPAEAVSAISIACYKKYVLSSLISKGQLLPLSKLTSNIVQRNFKTTCHDYTMLSDVFCGKSISEFQKFIETHQDTLKADNNYGLAKQALASLYKRNIQRLTQTYLTLSLQSIASLIGLSSAKEAENQILSMIDNGEIFASIDQKNGMVNFLEESEKYNNAKMATKMNSQIEEGVQISARVNSMDEEISCDRLYMSRVHFRDTRSRFGGESDDFDSFYLKNLGGV